MPTVSGYYRKADGSAVTKAHVLRFKRQSDGVEFTTTTSSTGAYAISVDAVGTYNICKICPGESTCEATTPSSVNVTGNKILTIKGPCNPTC